MEKTITKVEKIIMVILIGAARTKTGTAFENKVYSTTNKVKFRASKKTISHLFGPLNKKHPK
jgi:hypothetical protein